MMESTLRAGLEAMGLPTASVPSLERYAELLLETNKVMNLTAITEPEAVATLHFLDSAALLQFEPLKEKRVIDVGTGAGFPGLPLKIVEPDMDLTLLDSLGKRVTFLERVCSELQLERVNCVHARAEEYAAQTREQFDIAVSRAVAALPVLCELCLPFVRPGGLFIALKSTGSGEELAAAKNVIETLGGSVLKTQDYKIPATDVVHRLIFVKKVKNTPNNFPRPFAKIKKNSL